MCEQDARIQELIGVKESIDQILASKYLEKLTTKLQEYEALKQKKILQRDQRVSAIVESLTSKIIDTPEKKTKLQNLIKKSPISFKHLTLLYRGSVDTFAASAFHAKCDGKENTLSIIQSTKG